MRKLLIYLFTALLVVCGGIMVVSFAVTIPQWLSISSAVVVIVLCGAMLFFTRDKDKGDKK